MNNGSNNRVPDVETVSFNEKGEIVDNSPLKRFFLLLVIVLVSTLSFGLGRLSNEDSRAGVKIEFDPSLGVTTTTPASGENRVEAKSIPAPLPAGNGEVVASVKGTKYHFLYCSGAKQISEANKITFKNAALAEAAGYTLALNCKPR